jgi:dUTP pyrophosphatase
MSVNNPDPFACFHDAMEAMGILVKLRVKKLHAQAQLPTKANDHAAGVDFYALTGGHLERGQSTVVKTGVAVEIPRGYWGLVRLRSGVAAKWGLVIASSSTIDSDYRGELIVPVYRLDNYVGAYFDGYHGPFDWEPHTRLFQLLLIPQPVVRVEEVAELSDTTRGQGGFGHTGV